MQKYKNAESRVISYRTRGKNCIWDPGSDSSENERISKIRDKCSENASYCGRGENENFVIHIAYQEKFHIIFNFTLKLNP